MIDNNFPINPFPSVIAEDFDKNTKKKFTEDFIEENFKSQGWSVYEPFVDKGYDRVATKIINGKKITRFIQIKARALKLGTQNKPFAGYTIDTKDIIPDPRIVFVLFSHEKINEELVRDILIFPIVNWLKFMDTHNKNLFSSVGFKQGDGKFNDTYYQPETKKWTWKPGTMSNPSIPLDEFVNKKGMKLLEDNTPEEKFKELQEWIINYRDKNIYKLTITNKHPVMKKEENKHLISIAKEINDYINIQNLDPKKSKALIKKNNQIFNLNPNAKDSARKYFGNLEKEILKL